MATWGQFEAAEPAFAAEVRAALDRGVHKLLATLRRDGAPRISGIEIFFAEGDVWFGSMPAAVKARDLQRDGRYALHGPPDHPDRDDPSSWLGEVKFSGVAVEVTDPEQRRRIFRAHHPEATSADEGDAAESSSQLFRADVDDIVWTGLNAAADRLVIRHWNAQRGLTTTERE